MSRLKGTVRMAGRIGYTAQSAFILNATLKDNILFGQVRPNAQMLHTT